MTAGARTSEQRHLYDGLDLLETRDGQDTLRARFVHGPGIDNPLAALVPDGQGGLDAYYYHTDHLGSVRVITDDTGAIARTYDYSAYGVRLDDPTTDTTGNPFTYTGREYHTPSGLYFYRARWPKSRLLATALRGLEPQERQTSTPTEAK